MMVINRILLARLLAVTVIVFIIQTHASLIGKSISTTNHQLPSTISTLEKKYQDQIKLLEMDFSREKEIMIIQSNHLRQDIDRQMNAVQEQLSKFRSNIKILEEVCNRKKRIEEKTG